MKLLKKSAPQGAISLLQLASACLGSYAYPDHAYHASKAVPIVNLPYGRFAGAVTGKSSAAFLGIPYAQPPLGELRFRKPVPLAAAEPGKLPPLVDATKYPDFCVQGSTGSEAGGAGSEDCLKVNVYAPRPLPSKKLPVLFYIHGGGFRFGNPAAFPFEHWIEQSPEIIVVSVYYRLSVFGFFSSPFYGVNPDWGDLNVGLWDQIEALRWTKEHISHFGGDPNRVTIVGESAGGAAVQYLLTSPIAQGLFHGAIGQSVYRHAVIKPEESQLHYFKFISQPSLGRPPKDHMGFLRNATVAELIQAADTLRWNSHLDWLPVVDGELIIDYPTKLLAQGRQAHVPVIVGATTDETSFDPSLSLQGNLYRRYHHVTSPEQVAEFERAYPVSEFDSEDERNMAILGDTLLKCSREIQGEVYSHPGSTSRVWTYRFNQRNPTEPEHWGVGHASDNWFMFRGINTGFNGTTNFTPFTEEEAAFSEELIAYWISFVRTGDPNTYKLPSSPLWVPYIDSRHATYGLESRVDDLEQGKRLVLQQPGTWQHPRHNIFQEEQSHGQTVFKASEGGSSSHLEDQPEQEVKRCMFVASKAEMLQN